MAISVRCPHCRKKYKVDDALAGRTVRCKECQKKFRVPGSKSPAPPPEPVVSTPYLPQIEQHIQTRIGPVSYVSHEVLEDGSILDLHVVPPTEEKSSEKHPIGLRHFTIITSGMSARPMNVPAGTNASPYAELMIALPKNWPGLNADGTIDHEAMADERAWWPFRWLKTVARMPWESGTYIGPGHTIPNGQRAEPFAFNTRLGCMLAFFSTTSHRMSRLKINDELTINFYALYPLYPEEMNFKLQHGLEPLLEKLANAQITDLIKPDRASAIL